MGNQKLYILLLCAFFSPVAFSKNHYFEHYFSKYHKRSSTTSSISSTTETPRTISIFSSTQDDITSEDISSAEDDDEISFQTNMTVFQHDDKEINFQTNMTVLQHGDENSDPVRNDVLARVGSAFGIFVFIVVVIVCRICCCPKCRRGTERRGFIVGNNARGNEVLPQPVITQTQHQPTAVQHIPPEFLQQHVQQFPPQYQQSLLAQSQYTSVQSRYQHPSIQSQAQYSPVQPQYQYSPMIPGYQNPSAPLQFHNPPEAPPSYEAIEPK